MLAQRDTKLGRAHVFLCTLCFCMPTCFCMHIYPVSQLALHPVSLEPDVDGWTDGRRRGTTLHITRPGSPAKQTLK